MNQKMSASDLRGWLPRRAADVIEGVMVEAELSGHHTPGSWQDEGTQHHARHVVDHIAAYLSGDRSEPHLRNMLTRAAMMFWSDEHGVMGDNGPEGASLHGTTGWRCEECSAVFSRSDPHQSWCSKSDEKIDVPYLGESI